MSNVGGEGWKNPFTPIFSPKKYGISKKVKNIRIVKVNREKDNLGWKMYISKLSLLLFMLSFDIMPEDKKLFL